MTDTTHVQPPTRVPDGETPAARCPHCDRPFPSEELRDLHLGEVHDDLSDAEREAYEAALDAETDDLFVYHLTVIAALVALYAALVILYMIVLSG